MPYYYSLAFQVLLLSEVLLEKLLKAYPSPRRRAEAQSILRTNDQATKENTKEVKHEKIEIKIDLLSLVAAEARSRLHYAFPITLSHF